VDTSVIAPVPAGVEGQNPSTPVTPAEQVTEDTSELLPTPEAVAPQPERAYDWQRAYQTLAAQHAETQRRLDQMEEAGLSEEEVTRRRFERDRQALQDQQRQMAELMYATDLHALYSKFVPAAAIKGADPSEWQTSVLSYMQNENAKLRKQLETLRGAKPGETAQKVTAGGPTTPAPTKSAWDLTPEEREALLAKARMGRLKAEDLPTG